MYVEAAEIADEDADTPWNSKRFGVSNPNRSRLFGTRCSSTSANASQRLLTTLSSYRSGTVLNEYQFVGYLHRLARDVLAEAFPIRSNLFASRI